VVAVTAAGRVYVATEDFVDDRRNGNLPRWETRVWASDDGGGSWDLVVHEEAEGDCYYSVRHQVDNVPVYTPPAVDNISALDVSADGRYLFVATAPLRSPCGVTAFPDSPAGLYRIAIDDRGSFRDWESGGRDLVGALAPVGEVRADAANPNMVYLVAESGAAFRTTIGSDPYGWRRLDDDGLAPDAGDGWYCGDPGGNLVAAEHVRVVVYDVLGRRVQVLLDETLPPGAHRARWGGTDGEGHSLASGVYLYRLFLGGAAVSTRKVMLLR
jgi:hypothetical protein